MRIHLLPPSSEGFRRLAKAIAVVTFMVTIGYLLHDHAKWQASLLNTFADIHRTRDQVCLDKVSPGEPHDCLAASEKAYQEGISAVYERSWPVALQTWGSYAVWGLVGAYIAALCIRTLGWIALGFRKPAQP
jgi:hypothetical protein